MTNIVIKKHNFDKAKNNIKQFSLTKPDQLALKQVDVSGGLFNWFDHKVTGAELNSLTSQVQDYLIKFNNLNSKFIKEFGEVYNALEALDNEYIQGILVSVKAAEKASMEAKEAQKDIKKTIEVQKKTLKILGDFKDKLDKFKYLENIDEVWEDTQRFSKELRTIISKIQKLDDDALQQSESVKGLMKFKADLSKQRHLNSIDVLWDNAQEAKRGIKSIEQTLSSCTISIESQNKTISKIKSFTDNLNKLEHVLQIDEVWENTQTFKSDVEQLGEQIIEINKNALTNGHRIDLLINFVDSLKKLQHLYDIDQMWEDIEESKEKSSVLQGEVKSLEEKLVVINTQMSEQKKQYENEIQLLTKKNKNTMLLGGSSLGLVIILYVLNILGIV
ncbi:hypothetical protein [Lysinibacillus pakistanensis]|uniref:hypothetical protein n=1 Tax=Lysinibacillus pakistanensis TaxID=759811 RepID=UPI003D26BC9A